MPVVLVADEFEVPNPVIQGQRLQRPSEKCSLRPVKRKAFADVAFVAMSHIEEEHKVKVTEDVLMRVRKHRCAARLVKRLDIW